jgi:hypothetical protein
MNLPKPLRFLLSRFLMPGVVEVGGGAVVVDDDEVQAHDDGADPDGTDDEADPEGGENQDADPDSDGGTEDAAADDAVDEVVVTIGDETPPEDEDAIDGKPAPQWVKDLRRERRELIRKQRELEAENARLKQTGTNQVAAVEVGPEPQLSDPDIDFDAEKYALKLKAWMGRKAHADAEEAKRKKAEDDAKAAWQAKLDAYGAAKTKLKVRDFEDAETLAQHQLSTIQQGVILDAAETADSAATIMYALGKNPKKLAELAGIQNPVKFAAAVGKLETQLKVTPRKSAPPPESRPRSNVAGAAALGDAQYQRLVAEADKTGDRSKVAAYLRAKKAKQPA